MLIEIVRHTVGLTDGEGDIFKEKYLLKVIKDQKAFIDDLLQDASRSECLLN